MLGDSLFFFSSLSLSLSLSDYLINFAKFDFSPDCYVYERSGYRTAHRIASVLQHRIGIVQCNTPM